MLLSYHNNYGHKDRKIICQVLKFFEKKSSIRGSSEGVTPCSRLDPPHETHRVSTDYGHQFRADKYVRTVGGQWQLPAPIYCSNTIPGPAKIGHRNRFRMVIPSASAKRLATPHSNTTAADLCHRLQFGELDSCYGRIGHRQSGYGTFPLADYQP